MRAARLHRYGGPEVLQIDDVPLPTPGPGEVRIAVTAASLNPVDAKMRAGSHRALAGWRLPHTTGLDVSGTIDAVGAGVTSLREGDRVWSSPSHRGDGTCADAVVVPAREVALAPTTIPLSDAAALPLVGLTAWACFVTAADLRPGQRVLILNGSGGVGTTAIQLARALSAEVHVTCSARHADHLRRLGAHHVHDRDTPLPQDLADVTLVAIGGDGTDQAIGATVRGGHVTSIVGDVPRHVARLGPYLGVAAAGLGMMRQRIRGAWFGRRVHHVVRTPDGPALARLAALVDEGLLRPVIAGRYTLDQIVDAHRTLEGGHVAGKLVIDINPT